MGNINEFLLTDEEQKRVSGIVQTPEHIAEFMRDLIGYKQGDSIIDITAGAGALIKGCDKPYAVELEEFMAKALKAAIPDVQLTTGDAFDVDIPATDYSVLNPPYGLDTKEWEFAQVALDALNKGGKLAVIIPISSFTAKSKANISLKKELLESHTLEAVVGMPHKLFYSRANVVVAIAVLLHTFLTMKH